MCSAQLKRHEVGFQQAITRHTLVAAKQVGLQGAEIFTEVDHYTRSLIIGLRGYVWAEDEKARHVEVRYPKTWWQHFKLRWFPRSWLKRWPVQEAVVSWDVECLYPGFMPQMPSESHRLMVPRIAEGSGLFDG